MITVRAAAVRIMPPDAENAKRDVSNHDDEVAA
jgi:hypothetical protein